MYRPRITVGVVALVSVLLATATAAQEGPLHPPPFLEPTTLFLTVRPHLAQNSLDLARTTAMNADIFPHFILLGSHRCSTGGAAPCVSFTPAIRLRMENTESAPIESPSFIPRLNIQWLFRGRNSTSNIGLYLGHHSNGQADCLFIRKDQTCAADGSFTLDDLQSAAIEPNTANGNFSLNYARVAFDFGHYTSPIANERRVSGYRLSMSVDWIPDNWKYSSLRNGFYPTWQFHLMSGFAVANAPLCKRADIFVNATGYKFNRATAGVFAAQLTCIWSQERGLGLFFRYNNGRDHYNSAFFVPESHRLQFGLTINRLRTFGADY